MSRKESHHGRRGRKHQKQAQRLSRQDDVNEHERRLELERRTQLVGRIKPWMLELCRRSTCGIATDVKDDYHIGSRTFFCLEGRVESCVIGVETVDIRRVRSWKDLSTNFLESVAKRKWTPFREKNVLEIIAERVSLVAS
jgi:hypothetical protein